MVVLGEGDVQILLLTGLHADDLLLKAGNEGPGAQLQAVVLALAALEGLAVHKALEVDDSGVTLLSLTLDSLQAGGTIDVGLQLGLDILLRDLGHVLGSGQALIGTQLHLGTDGDQSLKGQALLAHGNDLHLGVAHLVQLLLGNGLSISLRVDLVDGIFIEHAGAVQAFHDLAGGLALAEAGHVDAGTILQVSLLDRSLKLLGTDLDNEFNRALFLFLYAGDLHVFFLLWANFTPLYLRKTRLFALSNLF